jgi:hypothetical protein
LEPINGRAEDELMLESRVARICKRSRPEVFWLGISSKFGKSMYEFFSNEILKATIGSTVQSRSLKEFMGRKARCLMMPTKWC